MPETKSTSPCKADTTESASQDSKGNPAQVATNSPSATDQVYLVGVTDTSGAWIVSSMAPPTLDCGKDLPYLQASRGDGHAAASPIQPRMQQV